MCVWQRARLPAWIWHFTAAKCRDFWSTLWAFPHQNGPPCEEPEPEWSRPGYRSAALMFFLLSVKEDEIFRHTTPLFLLRSKSPLGPSGVNKGRCSKWYANWKEGEGRKKRGEPRKSTRQPRISDTSHLERKFQCLGVGNSERRSAAPCTKPCSLRAGLARGVSSELSEGFVSGSGWDDRHSGGKYRRCFQNRVKRRKELHTQDCFVGLLVSPGRQ